MLDRTKAAMLSLALGALALAGVQATAQDGAQTGDYRLETVSGNALPTLVEEEDGCRDELLSATLTLAPDGAWTLVATERETCGSEVSTDEEREEGRYTMEGRTVRFTDDPDRTDEPDDGEREIEIEELAAGTLSGDALAVRLRDGETELVFRR